MDIAIAALLAGAGVAGGVANAIAGGATLITFPAMLAAGLPPVIANASNSVAVTPGHMVAAISDRAKLPPFDAKLAIAVAAALLAGTAGSFLLLATPERIFTLLVPALIAAATLIFAFGARLQALVRKTIGMPRSARPALVGLASVYGGYFGAGLGVILLAVLAVTGHEDVRAANALKNFLSTMVSFATIVIFAWQGAVSWPETLVVLSGAAVGGALGGRLIRILPPTAVRAIVIAVGCAMTLIYAWRYWL